MEKDAFMISKRYHIDMVSVSHDEMRGTCYRQTQNQKSFKTREILHPKFPG